uniref:8-amino-7-oxononanoate synthase n=1 Tax=Chlorobium chlorochromatii (strain CaD3) TaxID=340177 RepID=Q3ANX3_CHLCH
MSRAALYQRLATELEALQAADRFRRFPPVEARDGNYLITEGKRLLNLSSNDYLGLADNRSLLEDYFQTIASSVYPMSSSSSRLLTGNHPLYDELEAALQHIYQREAALVFNSGYHANIGILPALCGRHDLILSDRLNHASIVDGMKLSGATFQRYHHANYEHLETLLAQSARRYRHTLIVSESVFSMDGDCADLARLVALKELYGALLMVDEAHGAGVFGERGLGLCEAAGVVQEIDIIVGTFGKAFASTGAYAVMNSLVRDYLINTMRPLIFTTALPPVVLAWSLRTLARQTAMSADRQHLLRLAATLREALQEQGATVVGESHIVPVITGSNSRAVVLAAKLRKAGFYALPVRPPTVPDNSARIRLSLRATLSWDDVALLPALFREYLGGKE